MQPMLNIALRAARKAGDIIARSAEQLDRVQIELKGGNDFVTEVDRAAEREIIRQLSTTYPDHAVLGEESDASGESDAEYQWIMDPLDADGVMGDAANKIGGAIDRVNDPLVLSVTLTTGA